MQGFAGVAMMRMRCVTLGGFKNSPPGIESIEASGGLALDGKREGHLRADARVERGMQSRAPVAKSGSEAAIWERVES